MLLSACRTIGGFEPDVRHRADNTGVIVQLTAAGAVAIVSSLGWPDARTGTVLRPLAGVRIERDFHRRPPSELRATHDRGIARGIAWGLGRVRARPDGARR